MKFLLLLLALTLLGVTASADTALPSDVQRFREQRAICEHFRDEPWDAGNEPEIKARRAFIVRNIQKFCTGTDKRLASLRHKYRNKPLLLHRLRDYEDQIEVVEGKSAPGRI